MILGFLSCTGIPDGLETIKEFNADKYIGKWYEIARYDHSFERGLINVSAEYSFREDGGIKVVNKGFNADKKKWKEAEGKAFFLNGKDEGRLKVSFFGPFYGAYNIIALDKEDYSWSIICGPDRTYFWILAREKELEPFLLEELLAKAESMGFSRTEMIFVDQQQ